MNHTSLHFLWKDRHSPDAFRTGVSLHGHTLHSWENLKFLNTFKLPIPAIPAALRIAGWHHRRSTGRDLVLDRILWTPPLAPHEAHRIEALQIHKIGLAPLVSLTDHDDISAGIALASENPSVPISCEWTIPYLKTFFHLGIHNLPPAHAPAIFADLKSYTADPQPQRLAELLDNLHKSPTVLTVFNHPLWDEGGIGAAEHRATVEHLLSIHRNWIHAIELNGLRTWHENRAAIELAHAWRLPVVSGGDRHGMEPNANINLTRAETFAEFVSEIRSGRSTVLFMPQYRDPLGLRWFETVKDLTCQRPHGHRRRWVDRFFYLCDDGVTRPISQIWPSEGPALLRSLFAMLRLSDSTGLRAALRLAIADPTESPV